MVRQITLNGIEFLELLRNIDFWLWDQALDRVERHLANEGEHGVYSYGDHGEIFIEYEEVSED